MNTLITVVQSFYRSSAYVTAANDWKGIAGKYLTVLCLTCAVCWMMRWWLLFGHLAHSAQQISHEVPGVSMRQGRILLKSELPLVISSSFRKKPLLVIDTTTGADEKDYSAPLVVRGQDIKVYGFTDSEVTTVPKVTLPLKDMLCKINIDIDPSSLANTVTIVCLVLAVSMFLSSFALFAGLGLAQVFFWAAVGYLMAKYLSNPSSTGVKPTYLAMVRVATLALGPSFVIRAATALFGVDLPLVLDLVVVAIYLAYLNFAYRAVCPKTNARTAPLDGQCETA